MLITERLNLRKWTLHPTDVAAWHEIWGDRDVIWWGANPDIATSRDQLEAIIERIEEMDPGLGWWALVDKTDGHIIGNVCIQPSTAVPGDVEIGWHLSKVGQGRGYATEAAAALVQYAFGRLNLEHLIAPIVPTNEGSQRVAAKLGFVVGDRLEHFGYLHDIWHLNRPVEIAEASGAGGGVAS